MFCLLIKLKCSLNTCWNGFNFWYSIDCLILPYIFLSGCSEGKSEIFCVKESICFIDCSITWQHAMPRNACVQIVTSHSRQKLLLLLLLLRLLCLKYQRHLLLLLSGMAVTVCWLCCSVDLVATSGHYAVWALALKVFCETSPPRAWWTTQALTMAMPKRKKKTFL